MGRLASFIGIVLMAFITVMGCATMYSSSAALGGLSGNLNISGSSTVAPLVAEIAKRFEDENPGVRIDVQTGGSGKGIADVQNGYADIGMASRALKSAENSVVSYRIAADGVSIILHKDNPVKNLDDEQIIAIYQNRITNWKQVGGPDRPITVVHKAEGRATLEVFLAYFKLKNPQVKPDVVVGDNQHAVKTVAGDPAAIGYVSVGTAEAEIQLNTPIKLLPVSGVEATSSNVSSGEFPLSRPLNLVTNPDKQSSQTELIQAFIDYCQSEDVHDLVDAQHFVPASN